jgi:hypothetical protein
MSDRKGAQKAAQEVANLYIEMRHQAVSPSEICDCLRRAQMLYERYSSSASEYDFSVAEMKIDALWWELRVIPWPTDPIWKRRNSPYFGRQGEFKRIEDLNEGEMFRAEDTNQLSIVTHTTASRLTVCDIGTNGPKAKATVLAYRDFYYIRVLAHKP